MSIDEALNHSDFPCACLKISKDRTILWANEYFAEHYEWNLEQLTGANITSLFSKASQVFCDSYVYPKAMAEQVCKEVQLTVLTPSGTRRPVVANVKRLPDGGLAWVFIEADNRNSLFHELEAARDALQEHRAQLEHLSRTDALTGALNRRGIDEGMNRVFAEADRHGQPVSVLLMDIDHFKSINDVHGHQIGDEVLTTLGGILQKVCRGQDLVGRFGGDEFTCVLNHTNIEAARALCMRIHNAVADSSADLGGFTVSIGVAGRTEQHPLTWPQVIANADQALYQAKGAGRNTTFVQLIEPHISLRALTG